MRSNYLIYHTVIYLLTLNSSSNNFLLLLWVLITKSINILSCQMDKGTSKTSFYIPMQIIFSGIKLKSAQCILLNLYN